MSISTLWLNKGSTIVFEGLDKAGKSTQLDLLRDIAAPDSVSFAHMPSGHTAFTQRIYDVLEQEPPASGLARQLTHLACHSENMPNLAGAFQSRALVLDRWWWSTLAYGWYGGDVASSGISEDVFRKLIRAIWAPISASVVFLFLSPHAQDSNNVDGVELGYRNLSTQSETPTILVPIMPVEETHGFIIEKLIGVGVATSLTSPRTLGSGPAE